MQDDVVRYDLDHHPYDACQSHASQPRCLNSWVLHVMFVGPVLARHALYHHALSVLPACSPCTTSLQIEELRQQLIRTQEAERRESARASELQGQLRQAQVRQGRREGRQGGE